MPRLQDKVCSAFLDCPYRHLNIAIGSDQHDDSRWVHRPFACAAQYDQRSDAGTIAGRVYHGLRRLIAVRQETPAFASGELTVVDTINPHVLGYLRQRTGARVLTLANFSEHEQPIMANLVRDHGLSYNFRDLISGDTITLGENLVLAPYRLVWLVAI